MAENDTVNPADTTDQGQKGGPAHTGQPGKQIGAAQLIAAAPDPYLILARDFTIQLATDAYLAATFTKREEITGKYIFDVFPDGPAAGEANGMANLLASLRQVLSSAKPHQMGVQRCNGPGSGQASGGFVPKYWRLSNTPVLDEGGAVQCIIHKAEDVTEQVVREQKLEALERQAAGEKPAGNQAFIEEITQTTPDLITVHDVAGDAGPDQKWFDFYITKVGDAASRQVMVVFQDITDLQRARQELAQHKDLLQSVFDASYNGLSVLRSVRNAQGELVDMEYVLANRANKRVNQREDLEGKLYSQVHAGFRGTDYHEVVKRVMETGEPHQYQLRYNFEHLDNWFNITTVKLNDGVIISFEDISKEKQAEIALRKSEEQKAYLLQLSDAINPLIDPLKVQKEAMNILASHLKTDRLFYATVEDRSGQEYLIVDYDCCSPGTQSFVGQYPLYGFSRMISEDARKGTTSVVADMETDPRVEAEAATYRQMNIGSFIGKPIVKEGRLVGYLSVHQASVRHWTDQEIDLISETAERTWAAVERAKAEAALRESKERLQKAISIETVGVLFFGLDGRLKEWNTAFERMSGYYSEELAGLDSHALTPPEYESVTRKALTELAVRGETAPYEKELVRKDGSRFWAHCAPTRISGEGKASQCVEFILDVTDQKRAQQQLKDFASLLEGKMAERTTQLTKSAALLQSVFDASPNSITVLKTIYTNQGEIEDFQILMVNEVTLKTIRLTSRDVLGKRYAREFPHVIATGILEQLKRAVVTGEAADFEQWYEGEGMHNWFHFRVNALNDLLVMTTEDITGRKKAEAEIKKHISLLEQSEELAGMGSWEYDLVKGEFTWSEGMYRLFGLKKGSNVSPETYRDATIAEDRPIAEKIIQNLGKQPASFEQTLRINRNGAVRTLKVKGAAIQDAQGNPTKMLGLNLDITEVKRLEEENLELRLKQQKDLLLAILEAQEEERKRISESLHNGVGQLLYATQLSLQQMNPVNTLLLPGHESGSWQKTESLLKEAIRETRRVSHELVPVLLEQFGLDQAISEFCDRFSHTGMGLSCHGFDQRLEKHLELAIYRITQELVSNIAKHSGASRARLEMVREGGQLVIEAQDNGKGFPAGASVSKGIGLKTIGDRVKLLGGTIDMESAPGKGTLITIALPLLSGKGPLGEA